MNWSPRYESVVLRARRYAPYLLGVEIFVTLVFALVPVDSVLLSVYIWDKAQHFSVFAVLTLTASFAYPNNRPVACVGLLAFGFLIEILQASMTSSRSGELLDVIADGIGIVIGGLLYALIQRVFLPAIPDTVLPPPKP